MLDRKIESKRETKIVVLLTKWREWRVVSFISFFLNNKQPIIQIDI